MSKTNTNEVQARNSESNQLVVSGANELVSGEGERERESTSCHHRIHTQKHAILGGAIYS